MTNDRTRLQVMEDWYRDLVSGDTEQAERQMLTDLLPHRQHLRQLKGRVLDVGGGWGLAARFLPSDVDYVVLDPSDVWQDPALARFATSFRGRGPKPRLIKGVGESLPFPDADFDAVLAFWSLNHAEQPELCAAEMARVLRPGGSAYIVLEDMVPSWPDLVRVLAIRVAHRLGSKTTCPVACGSLPSAISAKLFGRWPIQDDHILIDEARLIRRARPHMTIRSRRWLDGFLTLSFERTA